MSCIICICCDFTSYVLGFKTV